MAEKPKKRLVYVYPEQLGDRGKEGANNGHTTKMGTVAAFVSVVPLLRGEVGDKETFGEGRYRGKEKSKQRTHVLR